MIDRDIDRAVPNVAKIAVLELQWESLNRLLLDKFVLMRRSDDAMLPLPYRKVLHEAASELLSG